MAGPHAVGAVALIISANPDLAGQVDTIETILEETAVPKTTDQICGDIPGSEVPNHTFGYGRIDVLAAVQRALDMITPTSVASAPENASIHIFPNPANEQTRIHFKNVSGTTHLDISNGMGQIIRQFDWLINKGDVKSLSIKDLPIGTYFYKCTFDSEVISGKLIRK